MRTRLDDRVPKIRERVIANLMPETCRIFETHYVKNDSGMSGEPVKTYILYNGFEDIPCRVDPTAHHRTEDVYEQEVIANEYRLVLPYDIDLSVDNQIEYRGDHYELRRFVDGHSWGLVVTALIVRLEGANT